MHTAAAATSVKCLKSALCSLPLFMMSPFMRHAVWEVFFGVHPAGWQNWSELKMWKDVTWTTSDHDVVKVWNEGPQAELCSWSTIGVWCFCHSGFLNLHHTKVDWNKRYIKKSQRIILQAKRICSVKLWNWFPPYEGWMEQKICQEKLKKRSSNQAHLLSYM